MNAERPPGLPMRKMHGLGNDFVVIDARGGASPVDAALARALGDRRRGVGFDQLAEIRDAEDADARIVFWNADGGQAGACGNATRCVADLLLAETGRELVRLRTERGLLSARRREDGLIEVDMGAPGFGWRDIPVSREVDTAALPIEGAPAAVSMGNPHCVFFVDDAEVAPVETLGPKIERHELFPERANVEFAQVIGRGEIRVRVWERGAGVTLACGSGACAVAAAARRLGKVGDEVVVWMDGGPLHITWDGSGGVRMAGPTTHVLDGVVTPSFLASAR